MKFFVFFFLSIVFSSAAKAATCGAQELPPLIPKTNSADFYSAKGREHEVTYKATFRSSMTDLVQVEQLTDKQQERFRQASILPMVGFLFGPAVHRDIGSPQKSYAAEVLWSSAKLVNGQVEVDYQIKGLWILNESIAKKRSFTMPVPLNQRVLFTDNWKKCSDSAPDHQTPGFLWYFWDPSRSGCDHRESSQYSQVRFQIGRQTENQKQSFPEYDEILRSAGKDRNLQMTIAFGYIENPGQPDPETDSDFGAQQYRSFVNHVRREYRFLTAKPILQNEYRGFHRQETIMGYRFTGQREGVDIKLNVVIAAEVDQMEIFSKSFAHDHDGFFAWFGHSRLGSGFDADHLKWRLESNPEYYSVSSNYQFVYWGGCNSYSYYTLPFFKFKADALGASDPQGTRTLDILSNGMPSFFSLNDVNARVILYVMMNWEKRFSYQQIVSTLEDQASRYGTTVLVAVLGDEDNPQ